MHVIVYLTLGILEDHMSLVGHQLYTLCHAFVIARQRLINYGNTLKRDVTQAEAQESVWIVPTNQLSSLN